MSPLAMLGVEPAAGVAREIQRCPFPTLVALGLMIAVMFGVMGLVDGSPSRSTRTTATSIPGSWSRG